MNVIINSNLKYLSTNTDILSTIISQRLKIIGRNYNYNLVDTVIFSDDLKRTTTLLNLAKTEQIIEEWNGSFAILQQVDTHIIYSILLPALWLYEAIEAHHTFHLDTALKWHIAKIHFANNNSKSY